VTQGFWNVGIQWVIGVVYEKSEADMYLSTEYWYESI